MGKKRFQDFSINEEILFQICISCSFALFSIRRWFHMYYGDAIHNCASAFVCECERDLLMQSSQHSAAVLFSFHECRFEYIYETENFVWEKENDVSV